MITLLLSSMLMFYGIQRPQLVEAQAMVESSMNPYARGKHGEKGAYQVIEKHWGKVPTNLYLQTKQNEAIINSLGGGHPYGVHNAVLRYNGAGAQARCYRRTVFAKALRISLLGIKEA